MSNLSNRKWWEAAGVRCLKTFAQAMIAEISAGAVGFMDVDWIRAVSVAGVAAVLSLLTSLSGLPEVNAED